MSFLPAPEGALHPHPVGDNDVFRLDPLEIREAELLKKIFQGFSFVLYQACFLVHVGSSHPTKFSQSLVIPIALSKSYFLGNSFDAF